MDRAVDRFRQRDRSAGARHDKMQPLLHDVDRQTEAVGDDADAPGDADPDDQGYH